jgi:hypothetical protein
MSRGRRKFFERRQKDEGRRQKGKEKARQTGEGRKQKKTAFFFIRLCGDHDRMPYYFF